MLALAMVCALTTHWQLGRLSRLTVEVATAYYQAIARNDLVEVAKYLHPDVHFLGPAETQGRDETIPGFTKVAGEASADLIFPLQRHVGVCASPANNCLRAAGSTGLTKWKSNPASELFLRSSSCPQPVNATSTTFRLHGCSRKRRATS
jgi:hypothetical protein